MSCDYNQLCTLDDLNSFKCFLNPGLVSTARPSAVIHFLKPPRHHAVAIVYSLLSVNILFKLKQHFFKIYYLNRLYSFTDYLNSWGNTWGINVLLNDLCGSNICGIPLALPDNSGLTMDHQNYIPVFFYHLIWIYSIEWVKINRFQLFP